MRGAACVTSCESQCIVRRDPERFTALRNIPTHNSFTRSRGDFCVKRDGFVPIARFICRASTDPSRSAAVGVRFQPEGFPRPNQAR